MKSGTTTTRTGPHHQPQGSGSSASNPETVISLVNVVDEEHYERLWKIEGLQKAVVQNVKLLGPLEIVTSEDSPLHSKWITTIVKDPIYNEISLVTTLDTIFNKDVKEVQSEVTAEFRSGSTQYGMKTSHQILTRGRSHTLNWPISFLHGDLDWDAFLNAEGEATVFIKISLYNASSAEELTEEFQFKEKSVANARQNVLLLLSGVSTEVDLKIVCSDGKEVKCHKEILKASSPVFKSMLESGLSESKSGMINVEDISGDTMEILVRYMYTGKLLEKWRRPETSLELTYAAGKYQMTLLLEYLDNALGFIRDDGSSSHFLISLRNLAEKLSLKKAEAKLTERIINRTLSIKITDDIALIFGSK